MKQLESDLSSHLGPTATPKAASIALDLLGSLDELSEVATGAIEKASAPLDQSAAAQRLAILAIHKPEQYLPDLMRHADDAANADRPPIAIRVCEVIEHVSDAKYLEDLEAIVTRVRRDSPLRVCAMSSIRRMKNPRAVPFLVSRVDDPDLQIAYLAVITLADITNKDQEFGPGAELFRSNPDQYRATWRKWWEQEGSRRFR